MHVVVFYLKGVIIIPLILQENIYFLFKLKSTSLASLVVSLFQEVQLGQEVPEEWCHKQREFFFWQLILYKADICFSNFTPLLFTSLYTQQKSYSIIQRSWLWPQPHPFSASHSISVSHAVFIWLCLCLNLLSFTCILTNLHAWSHTYRQMVMLLLNSPHIVWNDVMFLFNFLFFC